MTPEMWLVIIGGVIGIVGGAVAAIISGYINSKQQKERLVFEKNKGIREERIIGYQKYLDSYFSFIKTAENIIIKFEKRKEGINLNELQDEFFKIIDKFEKDTFVHKILFSDNIHKEIDGFFKETIPGANKEPTAGEKVMYLYRKMYSFLYVIQNKITKELSVF